LVKHDFQRCLQQLSATIGLSPAALGLGAGSDTNGPLAVAVIGDLVSSTLLTLVVIPLVYSLVEHRISRFHKTVIQ
jgi:HAE1 family hydrophobic/amphiphilic exporter-1